MTLPERAELVQRLSKRLDVFEDGDEIVISAPADKAAVLRYTALSVVIPLGGFLFNRRGWAAAFLLVPIVAFIRLAIEYCPERYQLATDGFHYTGIFPRSPQREAMFRWDGLKEISTGGRWGIHFRYETEPDLGGVVLGRQSADEG